ncbi:MAG: BMC domain-containing protein [Lactobacillales bacterium]|jgi:microcompartment protein CcmL/EutN|nr:BMC domain-containing protein [Lactobacillales bacterium]
MSTLSLGLVEVRGFLGAISVADASLKAADVHLQNAERIKGGLTTIELVGDVAAVESAVSVGVIEAKKLNCLIASHVIARVDEQTCKIIPMQHLEMKKAEVEPVIVEDEKIEEEVIEEIVTEISTEEITKLVPMELPKEEEEQLIVEEVDIPTILQKLQRKKVTDLRKLARKLNLQTLSKEEINFASKKVLMNELRKAIERGDIHWK